MASAEDPQERSVALPARLIHTAGKRVDPGLQEFLRGWLPGMELPTQAGDTADSRRHPQSDSLDKVLEDFSTAAATIDRQAAAQMTVGALALTVVGLLNVEKWALVPVAVLALFGVVLAQFGLLIFVGRMPGTEATEEGRELARTLFLRKLGLVTISQGFIVLALLGAALALSV